LARFYDVYGTWFATWKACSAFKDGHLPESERSTCLKQATAAEGQLLLIKIAIERRLSPPEVERLGRFREGYRQLRESIEAGAKLPFRVQYDDDKRNAYVAFKSLSAELAALLDGRRRTHRVRLLPRHETWGRPTLSQGQKKVVEVTVGGSPTALRRRCGGATPSMTNPLATPWTPWTPGGTNPTGALGRERARRQAHSARPGWTTRECAVRARADDRKRGRQRAQTGRPGSNVS
jgi:hypothetical protein